MYERILVPTDGTPAMEQVLSHAAALAAAHDAEIHALYVVDSARFSTLPADMSWEGVTDMLTREGEHALDRVREALEGVAVETAMVDGRPSREIVDYATEQGCDVVVMGTHGRGGLDRLLLGSVAEKVVRTAPIPVVTVPVETADDSLVPDRSTATVE